MQAVIGNIRVFKAVKGFGCIENGITTYLPIEELHNKLFTIWMEKNYPKLRLDSVTASIYKEVFIAACLIKQEYYE